MPRPPILPVLNWKQIFESGKTWEEWLAAAESAEQATRMRERFSTLALSEDSQAVLAAISRPIHVVAIAEDWCGDVIRHAPVLARLAESSPHIQARYIARHENPELFARFLTNGGEAIPKFIFLSEAFVECGNWGPMQADCRLLVARGKAMGNVGAGRAKVRDIYQADPGCHSAFQELTALAELAGATSID